MVFSELIAKILRERGITAKQLGADIGVTGQTINNLLNGRVIKPDGKTCERLLAYCKNYNIDASSLDWNEIIRDYFYKSKYVHEYEWHSDVDDAGTFQLRHHKCGHITRVPVMSLDGVSTPCIFCWIKSYMAQDAYSIRLNPNTTEFQIIHRHCHHRYTVSYEQIKQKKYYCPECYPREQEEDDRPSYGRRQDYRFIAEPERIPQHIAAPTQPAQQQPDPKTDELLLPDDDIPLDELSFEDFLASFENKTGHKGTKPSNPKTSPRLVQLEPLPPCYSEFQRGGSGFTIYCNVVSNYDKPIKLELKEIKFSSDGVVYSSDYNYSNYFFPSGHIFPECPRTFGKIWITDKWRRKKIKSGDELAVSIVDSAASETLNWVFVYRSNNWDLKSFDSEKK